MADIREQNSEATRADDASLLIRGKGTRRARCAGCHALVVAEALDDTGTCDSCGAQSPLFVMKPKRHRPVGARTRARRQPRPAS